MTELAWNRAMSSGSRPAVAASAALQSQLAEPDLEPCASTASLFLFAQGSQILCLHHDTLAIERRFQRHREKIYFISVDNVSERGAGRLVVSYDISQTAIVWDLFTGTEISRFASFEPLRVAAWMRNGNVAFGNGKGEVILFEPSSSEHISARTIFDPINALAPASDCRTYAIGYQNGSILISTLRPSFTILHTLTTSRGPSAIVGLAWHASSSKQKSDMLATLTADGDLRVWSVSKPPTGESPRVIRVLKRPELSAGPKWIAWSKNGRIVQYADGETWIWDVKTKNITYEVIATIDNVRAMANYGPTATLFTLGSNHTVQQYDLENPAMVANVQHLPIDTSSLPPYEGSKPRSQSPRRVRRSNSLQGPPDLKDTGEIKRTTLEMNAVESARQQRADMTSPLSVRSRTGSVSSKSSGPTRQYSPPIKSAYSGTSFALTSPASRDTSQLSTPQLTTPHTGTSFAFESVSSARSIRPGSRLRNEITYSPTDKPLEDLFPYTRARVNDVYYKQHHGLDEAQVTPDDLRRYMLSVVFCWDGDIEGLIKDELYRHHASSQNAIFLSRWLGESNPDHVLALLTSGSGSASAWMFLALSQMGGHAQANKVGQAFVRRLLEIGDVHASATVLLALGDRNDAIEVYVSRHYYMEAVLMTCLLMPSDWQRLSYLVRRWGEYVVSSSQQQLAIRCFMCTNIEPSEPWTSPTAQHAVSFAEEMAKSSSMAPPELLSPIHSDAPAISLLSKTDNERLTVKTSALKLITSFNQQPHPAFRFPGLKTDDHTPTNVPGITPIADSAVCQSALSPGGLGYRLNNVGSINNAMSGKAATPSGYSRHRLPSIGETPADSQPSTFSAPNALPTPVDSGSDKEKGTVSSSTDEGSRGHQRNDSEGPEPTLLLTSARYEPDTDGPDPTPQTAIQGTPGRFRNMKGLPSPPAALFESLKEQSRSRNGSRDRKPEGLQIQLPPIEQNQDLIAAGVAYPAYTPSQEQTDTTMETRSPASTLNSFKSAKSPSSRSIDQYISSLDEANYYARHHRRNRLRSRERRPNEMDRGSDEQPRGRSANRYLPAPKRSPSSPVPMSPEEFARYNTGTESFEDSYRAKTETGKQRSRGRVGKANSRTRSPSRTVDGKQKSTSRNASRRYSRGRSAERGVSALASPTSPVPMSASGEDIYKQSSTFEESLRFVTVDRERLRSRQRSRQRSSSRRPERGTSARRDPSPDRRRPRGRSHSRQAGVREANLPKESNLPAVSDRRDVDGRIRKALETLSEDFGQPIRTQVTVPAPPPASAPTPPAAPSPSAPILSVAERTRRELAAAELEARRLSLARRTSETTIPHPADIQHIKSSSIGRSQEVPLESPPSSGGSFSQRVHNKVSPTKHSPDYANNSDSSSSRSRSGAPVGLPATPRAMRHPKYSDGYVEDIPAVPELPSNLTTYQVEAARISRSMSVPNVGEFQPPVPTSLPMHPRFRSDIPSSRSTSKTRAPAGHGHEDFRELAPSPSVTVSIEEASQTVTVEAPPILPELRHLTVPPPPPPIPGGGQSSSSDSDTINIGLENAQVGKDLIRPFTTGPAVSEASQPTRDRRMSFDHRRGRSINESIASKLRNFTGRMRSTSRGPPGGRSPPLESDRMSPYESIPMVTSEHRS
ncbi:hypothetical protein V8E54_001393 [Elaphomyces granulatus]